MWGRRLHYVDFDCGSGWVWNCSLSIVSTELLLSVVDGAEWE